MVEFYRGMELLKGYQSLNRAGLEKMLHKFDKNARHTISGEYAGKLNLVHFYQSNELENLMDRTAV